MKELIEFRYTFFQLLLREIRVKYRESLLGAIWSFVNPVIMISLYYLLFSMLTERFSMDHYELYLLSTMVPWMWFQSGIAKTTPIFREYRVLLKQIYVPKFLLVAANVLAESTDFLIALLVVALYSALLGKGGWNLLLLPFLILFYSLFVIGCSSITATADAYFKDTEHILNNVLTVLFFASPVLYPVEVAKAKLTPTLFAIYSLNPMVHLLGCFRAAINGDNLHFMALLLFAAITIAFLVVGYAVVKSREYVLPEIL